MAGLDIKLERRPEGVLARLAGSVDTSTVENLERSLQSLLAGGTRLVVIDLAGVDYVNSRGMALFIKHDDKFRTARGRLVLCGLNDSVRPMFEVMGLLEALSVVDDAEKVLAAAKPAGRPVNCPGCGAEISVTTPGGYRCSRCSSPFRVNRKYHVKPLTGRRAASIRLDIPLKGRFAAPVRQAVMSLAEEYLLEGQRLWRVVDEVIGVLVEAAGRRKTPPVLSITLAADQEGMGVVMVLPEALKDAEAAVRKILEELARELKKWEWTPLDAGGKALTVAI